MREGAARAQVAQLTGVLEATQNDHARSEWCGILTFWGNLPSASVWRLRVGEVQDALRGDAPGEFPQGALVAPGQAWTTRRRTALLIGKLFVRSLAHLDPFHPFQFRRA
jgi:hypothetical protein